MADALDALDADRDNAAAWALFQQTVTRFTMDAHLVGALFDRLTADVDRDELADLVQRFEILYNAMCPPLKRGSD